MPVPSRLNYWLVGLLTTTVVALLVTTLVLGYRLSRRADVAPDPPPVASPTPPLPVSEVIRAGLKRVVSRKAKHDTLHEFVDVAPHIDTSNETGKLHHAGTPLQLDIEEADALSRSRVMAYWFFSKDGKNPSVVGVSWDEADEPTYFEAGLGR